jgi:hypothetical protein
VRALAQEVSLVSEKHQYGGTPDTIALIDGRRGLLEFKSSPKPYPDHLVAMAAHGRLWEERYPDQPLDGGYHLIILPKDGSEFQHHAYRDLALHWRLFQLYLEAYRLEKGGELPKVNGEQKVVSATDLAMAAVGQKSAEILARNKAAEPTPKRRHTRQPKTIVPAPKALLEAPASMLVSPALSMAEILRGYGHIPEVER